MISSKQLNVILTTFTIFTFTWQKSLGALCATKECSTCETNCPSMMIQRSEYLDCVNKLNIARSKYVREATLDCKIEPCAQRFLKTACGYIPSTGTFNRQNVLQRLDTLLKEENARKANFDQKAIQLGENVSPQQRQYYDNSISSFITITRNFLDALAIRAHAFRQSDYMASGEYRQVQKEVFRLQLENDARRTQATYWQSWNETLSNAVQTSPLAVERLRNRILEELKLVEEEIGIIDILQQKGLTKEQRITFIYYLKELMIEQLHKVQTQTAQLRQEQNFLEGGHDDMLQMLNGILDDIRKNHSVVQCGPLALSEAVTETIGKVAGVEMA